MRLSLAIALFFCAHASADVLSLTAVADGTLWNDPAGSIANGSGPVMIVGRAGAASTAPVRRAVVRFDVAGAIPAGSTIRSARLELNFTSGNTGARNIELHRLADSWGEGASNTTSGQGDAAQAGDATWLHRFFPNTTWSTPGGDFDAAVSAVLAVDALGVYTWPTTSATENDVQTWLDTPNANHGWLLKLDLETTAQTAKVFGTREATLASERPQLIVDFDPPPVFAYCTALTSPLGCTPNLSWTGTASVSSGQPFQLRLSNAINARASALAYGTNGQAAVPFAGGLMCVAAPLRRIALASTLGNGGVDDCSGARSFDFNNWINCGRTHG